MEKVNRWIFYILGMVVLAAGITLNTKTGLGVSPIISVAYCVSQIFELNFGDMTFVLYGIFVVVQLFLRERRERLTTLLQFPLSLVFSRLLNLCSACIPYQAAAHSLPENLAVLALAIVLPGWGWPSPSTCGWSPTRGTASSRRWPRGWAGIRALPRTYLIWAAWQQRCAWACC